MGVMVVLAMVVAVVMLGGGVLLTTEAAVSAVLIASLEPTVSGWCEPPVRGSDRRRRGPGGQLRGLPS
jgi:hypothetical protein